MGSFDGVKELGVGEREKMEDLSSWGAEGYI